MERGGGVLREGGRAGVGGGERRWGGRGGREGGGWGGWRCRDSGTVGMSFQCCPQVRLGTFSTAKGQERI